MNSQLIHRSMLSAGVLLGGLASLAAAQFPPKPEGVTVLRSKFHENVTISFKEVCDPFIVPASLAAYLVAN